MAVTEVEEPCPHCGEVTKTIGGSHLCPNCGVSKDGSVAAAESHRARYAIDDDIDEGLSALWIGVPLLVIAIVVLLAVGLELLALGLVVVLIALLALDVLGWF